MYFAAGRAACCRFRGSATARREERGRLGPTSPIPAWRVFDPCCCTKIPCYDAGNSLLFSRPPPPCGAHDPLRQSRFPADPALREADSFRKVPVIFPVNREFAPETAPRGLHPPPPTPWHSRSPQRFWEI